ncbi:hypothetical protein IV203_031154 [Nitzschia inconspicua]|uniref:Uncharacterized protein n=1 Tax=Nitzschia inconspicua TaxID=303405 RepID=A0A9K3Q2D2_9STRA|nr:hypothetical protein IV203_031154 [Nitzschia inconspicua]
MTSTWPSPVEDPFLYNLCRKRISPPAELKEDLHKREVEQGPKDDGVLNLTSLQLDEYSNDQLNSLSRSIGRATAVEYLELNGVDRLNWNTILGQDNCSLRELVVTIQSQKALGELAWALSYNTSLVRLELNYFEEPRTNKSINFSAIDVSDVYASINQNLLLEAMRPIQQIVVRGLSPKCLLKSSSCQSKPCSWYHLTLEDCNLKYAADSWIAPAIHSLQAIILCKCQLSAETIQSLSEAYLEYSTRRNSSEQEFKRKKKKTRKTPLQVLNLSSNTWDDDRQNNGENKTDVNGSGSIVETLSLPESCLSSLATWMDSLSNLVELDLSNNPQLFLTGRGMGDLCSTLNNSLQRLSLRHCGLCPADLRALVSTFFWIEALDLSENSALMKDLSPLLSLEYLSELVLENMSENGLTSSTSDAPIPGACGLNTYLQALVHEKRSSKDYLVENPIHKPIKSLNLSGNILQEESLLALSALSSLRVLILINCQLESRGLTQLLRGGQIISERCAVNWKELYLGYNNIGDDGAVALARALKNQHLSSLRVLQLDSNIISLTALKALVHDGLAHSSCLESMTLWDVGASTTNQQSAWQDVEKLMHHYLLLNQAGRVLLFLDRRGGEEYDGVDKKEFCRLLWPIILEQADRVYGANALYHFLQKRPDIVLPTKMRNKVHAPCYTHTQLVKDDFPRHSPRSVADLSVHD